MLGESKKNDTTLGVHTTIHRTRKTHKIKRVVNGTKSKKNDTMQGSNRYIRTRFP